MTADPLVTPDHLAAYQDGDPDLLLEQATALVRRYCGWHIAPVLTETITVPGSGARVQVLPTMRITEVTDVINGTHEYTADDYTWSAAGGELIRVPTRGIWVCDGPVTLTLTHGFDVVDDVAAVILAVASRAQKSPDGTVRRQAGPFSESYSQTAFNVTGGVSFVAHEKDILDQYRLAPRP